MKLVFALMLINIIMLQEVKAQNYAGETTIAQQQLEEATFMGPTKLKQVKAKSLSVMGPLEFSNLSVENSTTIEGPVTNSEIGNFGPLKITGPFTAKNITCQTLDVTGPVEVTDLKVNEDTNIIGPLKAQKGQLNNLVILADEISLEDIDANNITIKNDKNKQQVLRLRGNTTVKGTITFESRQGIVEQDAKVKVQGEIQGATIKKQ